jgi:hypothetical protein
MIYVVAWALLSLWLPDKIWMSANAILVIGLFAITGEWYWLLASLYCLWVLVWLGIFKRGEPR